MPSLRQGWFVRDPLYKVASYKVASYGVILIGDSGVADSGRRGPQCDSIRPLWDN